uniref:Uncharacterized protein n=1 Tax=Glossina palpalis gambiensis TaxID=67801 RepID=A0A1B0BEA4_9MUSC
MTIHDTSDWVELLMKLNSMLLHISKSRMIRFRTRDLGDMQIQLGRRNLTIHTTLTTSVREVAVLFDVRTVSIRFCPIIS